MTALAEIQGHTFYLPALGPSSVVFDLGAAGGVFGQRLHEMTGCRSLCAEASPSVFEALSKTPGVEALHVAVGGTEGPVAMCIGGYEADSYWVRGADGAAQAGDTIEVPIEVPGATLESLMAQAGVDYVDLIKLDIEGAEFAFFDAAPDAVLARIGQMSVEFHDFLDAALTPRVTAVIGRLRGLGFDAVVMTRSGHGDVLFLNRRRLDVGGLQLLAMRTVVKYGRGLKRMLARKLGRAA